MRNYKISFFKIERKKNEETGKMEKTGQIEFLGFVFVDDYGTHDRFTLQAKAFRHAPTHCLVADKVRVEQV